MSAYPNTSVSGIRVVGVGDAMTYGVPLDADVRVLDGFTLVCTREGTVHRLVVRGDQVVEGSLTTEQRNQALAMFGR